MPNNDIEQLLNEDFSFADIRKICQNKPFPSKFRTKAWKVCLESNDSCHYTKEWDGLYNLDNQEILRSHCQAFVDDLDVEETCRISLLSDVESVITYYCKSRSIIYSQEKRWLLHLVKPLMFLNFSLDTIHRTFSHIVTRYIIRRFDDSDLLAFHIFRLILLYHDPKLCSFLESKKIYPELYSSQWFQTLFADSCSLEALYSLWDVYFQIANPFLIFFISLVFLENLSEHIQSMKSQSKESIIETIKSIPREMSSSDMDDLFSAANYYASHTPSSILMQYKDYLFGDIDKEHRSGSEKEVCEREHFCLHVLPHEILSSKEKSSMAIKFSMIDCRTASMYNSGHLMNAYHLESSLMLQDLSKFSESVESILTAIKNASLSKHICIVGTGVREDEKYLHMVIAFFLQKHQAFLSFLKGGYIGVHEATIPKFPHLLVDHNVKECRVCNSDFSPIHVENGDISVDSTEEELPLDQSGLMKYFSTALKLDEVKDKLNNFIPFSTNANDYTSNQTKRRRSSFFSNVSPGQPTYRNIPSLFSIVENCEESDNSDNERSVLDSSIASSTVHDCVHLEAWCQRHRIIAHFRCHFITASNSQPSHFFITPTHVYVIKELDPKCKGLAHVTTSHPISQIIKITCNKKMPELVTLKYGFIHDSHLIVKSFDKFHFPKPGDVIKIIKNRIFEIMELDNNN